MDKKLRVVLLAFVGLLALSFFGGVIVFIWLGFFADALVYIHHQGPGEVEVWVDDELHTQITHPGVTEVRFSRGDHVLELRGDSVQTWELRGMNGLDDQLVPTDSSTCFVVLGVTYALYEMGDPSGDVCQMDLSYASIVDTYDEFPREVGRVLFDIQELPEQRSSGTSVHLTVPVQCARLPAVNAEALLRRELGCPGLSPPS